ncbi:MAG: transposase [Gammaproteobacteria bacterium]|nr:transposase [Gammaproteobacteria bacterium]
MARSIHCGYHYHVCSHGQGPVMALAAACDRDHFESLLLHTAHDGASAIVAYAVLPDRFHLLLTECQPHGISQRLHRLLSTYAHWHRSRYQQSGGLWRGRFKAFPVEPGTTLNTVVSCIEYMPVRLGLVDCPVAWSWSSSRPNVDSLTAPGMRSSVNPATAPRERDSPAHPPSEQVLQTFEQCIARSAPMGSPGWVNQVAQAHDLSHTLRPRGRPRGSGRRVPLAVD